MEAHQYLSPNYSFCNNFGPFISYGSQGFGLSIVVQSSYTRFETISSINSGCEFKILATEKEKYLKKKRIRMEKMFDIFFNLVAEIFCGKVA